MGEYIGKITVPKDTMLHVVNNIFHKNVKESTTKENILKVIPEIYTEENLVELIKMLPYEAYLALEELIEFLKTSEDIETYFNKSKYTDVYYLKEAMIIVMRIKHLEYNYSLNPGVIQKLTSLFNEKNRKIAQRYGKIEKLTKGMLYSYGVVEFDFLRKQLCKYMGEIISEKELHDIFFTKLNLNLFVNYYDIRWTNTNEIQSFVTYLDEEEIDVGDIATEQKSRGLQYKEFNEKEILNREEYLWNNENQRFYEFIKSKNDSIWEFQFKRLLKNNELGENILREISNMCKFKDEIELKDFIELFTQWYNNSPQYILGGYSPNEFKIKCK